MGTHFSILPWRIAWAEEPSRLQSKGLQRVNTTEHSTAGIMGFPGGSDGKESACNLGDPNSIPGSERSPEEGIGNPFQYSCLENFMDRGAWQLQSMGSQRVGHN